MTVKRTPQQRTIESAASSPEQPSSLNLPVPAPLGTVEPSSPTRRLAATLIRASGEAVFSSESKIPLMLDVLRNGSDEDLTAIGVDVMLLSRLDASALATVSSFSGRRAEIAAGMLDVFAGNVPADEETALACARHPVCRSGRAALPLLGFPAAAVELLRSKDPQVAFRALLTVREHAKQTLLDERSADGEIRSERVDPRWIESAFDRFDATVRRALEDVLAAGHLRALLTGVLPLADVLDTGSSPGVEQHQVARDSLVGRVPFWGEGRVDVRRVGAAALNELPAGDLRLRLDWLLSRHLVPTLYRTLRRSLQLGSFERTLPGVRADDEVLADRRLLVDWMLAATPPVDKDVNEVKSRAGDADLDEELIRSVLVRSAAGNVAALLALLQADAGGLAEELVPLRDRMLQPDLRSVVDRLDVTHQPDHPSRLESWAVVEFFAEFGSSEECSKVVKEIEPLLSPRSMWSPGRERARRVASTVTMNPNITEDDLVLLAERGIESARLRRLAPSTSMPAREAVEVALLGWGPRYQEAILALAAAADLVGHLEVAFREAPTKPHPARRLERLVELVGTLTRPSATRAARSDWAEVSGTMLLLPAKEFVRRTPKAGFKSWLVPVASRAAVVVGDDPDRWVRFARLLESASGSDTVLDVITMLDGSPGGAVEDHDPLDA